MAVYDVNGNIISAGGNGFLEILDTKRESVDIFPYLIWHDGYYLAPSTNKITSNSAWSYCDYHECVSGETLIVRTTQHNANFSFVWYNQDKQRITHTSTGYVTTNADVEIAVPSEAAYFRISIVVGFISKMMCFRNTDVAYHDWVDTETDELVPLLKRKEIFGDSEYLHKLLWNYEKWRGKKLVVDGNSLVDVAYWGETLASFLGMECVNLGRSGQSLVSGVNNAQGQAVYPNVWTAETIIQRVTNDYPAQVDLIMLQGDSNSAMPNGSYTDQMDGSNPSTSWFAKMNYLIRCLKAKYPNVIIVLMPDQVRYDGAVKAHKLELNHVSIRTMREIAEYNRIAYYDFEHATPFNPLHGENNWYSLKGQKPNMNQDYTHASGTGGQRVYGIAKGKALAGFVSQLIFDPNAPNDAVQDWTSLI